MKLKLLFLAIGLSASATQVIAKNATIEVKQPIKIENVYTKIADHYLHTVSNIFDKITTTTTKKNDVKTNIFKINPLQIAEQNKTIFQMLYHHGDKENHRFSDVFDNSFWNEMELFSGAGNNKNTSLTESWNNHETTIGNIVGKRISTQQTSDTKLLKQRQSIIQILLDDKNKNLVENINSELKNINQNEGMLWNIFTPEYMSIESLSKILYPFWDKYLPNQTLLMELNSKHDDFNLLSSIIKPVLYLGDKTDLPIINNVFFALNLIAAPISVIIGYYTSSYVLSKIPDSIKENKKIIYSYYSAMTIFMILIAYLSYKRIKQKHLHLKSIQEQMISVASVVKSIQAINKQIKTNDILLENIPSIKSIDQLATIDKKLKRLIEILNTRTFKGKPSVWSISGRILSAYSLLCELKNNLVQSLEAIGEVDAYLSMAKTINQHKETVQFCFPEFIEDNETPQLEINNFWLPQLLHDPKIKSGEHAIVPNSISMDQTQNRNIILTGPNTGGKSTILKGIISSLLLAQTFGVAPAQSMRFTPFKKIQTYINIPDNAAEGISLFKAELLRVKALINTMRNLQQGEFSFSILDEVFSGTNPLEAVAGSKQVMTAMSQLPNSMNVIATHFGELTEMEQELNGAFVNHKVSVERLDDETLQFPYTWKPGISDQKIALDLLKQENFLNDLIS